MSGTETGSAGWPGRAGRWRRRYLTANRVAVGAITALTACAYSGFELIPFGRFRTSSYDLVIFYQAVRSYAHFQPGISIIKGVRAGFGPDFSVLGDHFSPILATLAPLLWIADRPQTLLIAQGALFALAIPPLWLFTRRALGGGPKATAAAYLVAVAYALSWPIASALAFDFHEAAFAPVLTAVALERLQAGRLRWALLALTALLLVKEDMGLLVAGIGGYLAVARPPVAGRPWLTGLCLIGAGVADTWIATRIMIPAFGGNGNRYWAYDALGRDVPQAAAHLALHPLSSLRLLVTPQLKLTTMVWLLAAFCFLPLLSPITIAAVPLLLERMLGSTVNAWDTSYHYNAYLVIILICAAVDGAARLDRWIPMARQRIAIGGACALAVVAVALVPRFSYGDALVPAFYQSNARTTAAAAAVAVVPDGVTVEAANNLGPQLASRDTVLLWDSIAPRWAPWVVADAGPPRWPFLTVDSELKRVGLLLRSGYRVVFERDGYLVLHRVGTKLPNP